MMDPTTWNAQEQALPASAEDDFQQFLEMGGMPNLGDGIQFDFPDFGGSSGGAVLHRDSIDTPMSGTETPSTTVNMQNQMTAITSGPGMSTVPSQMVSPAQDASTAISEIEAQIQFLQHQKMQQQQRQLEEQQRRFQEQQAAFFAQQQRNMIPPTPHSLELQCNSQFYSQGEQSGQHSSGMFDKYQQMREQQDMAFTPLVSPAVTPLDAHFPVETQYTVPGAYFSPLTSPALHAQNDAIPGFEPRPLGTATTSSPVDLELDSSNSLPPSSVDLSSKKSQKNKVTKARKSSVRQSPMTKPQRKKTATTPLMNAQILSELAETEAEGKEARAQQTSVSTNSTPTSEDASVSPENLSEMPPPPVPQPRSARPSPFLQAQSGGSNPPPLTVPPSINGVPSPATPASLFRISPKSKSGDASTPGQVASEHIESFELPPSVNFSKLRSTQANPNSEMSSPTDSEVTKGSAFQPLPSPVFQRPSRQASLSGSPALTPKSSTPNPRRTPLMAPRGSKKRGSISSVHASPALLPRISPNIKPLLPGTPGLSAEDTASRLLASKSNYQNILEGNTVPGVSYPSELSTNLTSKRTSHKIAEQGRRNRINSALQEIATLLPKDVSQAIKADDGESPDNEKPDKKDGKQGNGPNSKASTVEMAIVYIKQLQKEVADAKRRAEEAEKRLEMRTAAS